MTRDHCEPSVEIHAVIGDGDHRLRMSGEPYGLFMEPGAPDGDGEIHVNIVDFLAALKALGFNRADMNLMLADAGWEA